MEIIFIDRDGTINIDKGCVHKKEDWEFTPRAIEGLQMLQVKYRLVVVTNQAGIALGKYALEDMLALHEYMDATLRKNGIFLSAVCYCPHHWEENCDCRKPKTGMIKQIDLKEIDYPNSWMIGDKPCDVGFGKNLGTKTILLQSRYWKKPLETAPDHICENLWESALQIYESC